MDTRIEDIIRKKMKEIALVLMQHENKSYCLAQVHPNDWSQMLYQDQDITRFFIVVPSPMFNRLILKREYLKIIEAYPEHFGTSDDRKIITAIKKYDENSLAIDYSTERFLDYIRQETMAYIFEIVNKDIRSDRILRLDLCRGINDNNEFQGGFFHVLKHFTIKEYPTLSSFGREFPVESWEEILRNIILNFFSKDFMPEQEKHYEAISKLKDGHTLRGIYYKEKDIPVAFLQSLRVDK